MSEAMAQEAAGAIRMGAAGERSRKAKLLEEAYALEGALSTHAPPHAVALALPRRWTELAKSAREAAFSAKGRLRSAIPPCCAPAHPREQTQIRLSGAALSTPCLLLSLGRFWASGVAFGI